MITAERMQEIRHIAPTAGPLGQEAINELVAEVERLTERAECACLGWRTGRHRKFCRRYVGPLTHAWIRTGWNETFGGLDYFCSCGGWFRQGGIAGHGDGTELAEPICPKADQAWRGAALSGGHDA